MAQTACPAPLARRLLLGAGLALALGVPALVPRPCLGADNYGASTTTLTGDWVNYGTVETSAAPGMNSATGENSVNHGGITTSGASAYGIKSTGSGPTNASDGTINTTGTSGYGIQSTATGATVVNAGSITTAGSSSYGIQANGSSPNVNNSGSITTGGLSSFGIISTAVSGIFKNSGTIKTTGASSTGILSTGAGSAFTNSGSITTGGSNAHGIWAGGATATVTNSGSINATDGNGIHATALDATLTNAAGGSITVSGATRYGINSTNSNADIGNAGTITTSGNTGHAIMSSSSYATISNSGTITTSGAGGVGIRSGGLAADITNTGSITTQNGGSGIYASGTLANVNNATGGSISTQGIGAYGVWTTSNTSQVANGGSIQTGGDQADGIFSTGYSVSSSGAIRTSGDNARGISSNAAAATISNSGTIRTSGDSSYGVYASGSDATVGNSGAISTTGAAAHGIVTTTGSNISVTNAAGGSISVGGADANAVELVSGSLVSQGTLSSLNGMAVNAVSSQVRLQGGSITGAVAGDAASDLSVEPSAGSLSFRTLWLGDVSKSGAGTWIVLGNSSAGTLSHLAGTMDVRGQFSTPSFTQAAGSTLILRSGGAGTTPLTVTGTAAFNGGSLLLDAPITAAGTLVFIDTANLASDFSSIASANPSLGLSTPAWQAGGLGNQLTAQLSYKPSTDNSALGLTAALRSWDLPREVALQRLALLENFNLTGLAVQGLEGGPVAFDDLGTQLFATDGGGGLIGVYVQPFLGTSERRGSGLGYTADQTGLLFGVDHLFGEGQVLGIQVAVSDTSVRYSSDDFSGRNHEDQNTVTLGGYGSARLGPWQVRDSLTFNQTSHDSHHDAGGGTTATADYHSYDVGDQFLVGYVIDFTDWRLTPEAGLEYDYVYRESFQEDSGASYAAFNQHFLDSVLSLAANGSYELDRITVSPLVRAAWHHALTNNEITVLPSVNGGSSVPVVQNNDNDRLVLDLACSLRRHGLIFGLGYTGTLGEHVASHGGWCNVRYEF
mgnify:CR=1 FL=1